MGETIILTHPIWIDSLEFMEKLIKLFFDNCSQKNNNLIEKSQESIKKARFFLKFFFFI